MNARLATLLVLPLTVTACVTEEDPFGDLAPYEEQTGGGKFDDPNCTDVTYRAFIQKYLASTVTAEENPCMAGNDASYRIWAYAASKELAPTVTSYTEKVTKRFTDRNIDDAQLATAGTLTQAQRDKLALLVVVKPAHAGRVGYAAWAEYLGRPALPLATRPIAYNTVTPGFINQKTREITAYENEWLTFVEQAQPIPTEGGSEAIWLDIVQKDLEAARKQQTELDVAYIKRQQDAKPQATFDSDGAAFHATITNAAATAVTSSVPSLAAPWKSVLDLTPKAGGRASYGKWVTAFIAAASVWNQRTRTDEERALLAAITAVKPCASGPEVDEVVGRARTNLTGTGNDPTGTSFKEVIVPVACATMP